MTKRIRVTKAFLDAKLAAVEAENHALRAQLDASERENAALRAQLQPLGQAIASIQNRGQLLAKLRELSVKRVPCAMRGDAIIHTKTGAVLAQVTRPEN